MSSNVPNKTTSLPEELAQAKLDRIVSQYEKVVEEHSATYKWLMASLLTINLGGLLTIAGITEIVAVQKYAGIAMVVGVLGALTTGWVGQVINRKAAIKLSEQELFWRVAVIQMAFDPVEGNRLDQELNSISTLPAKLAGGISVAGWLVGVALLGLSL